MSSITPFNSLLRLILFLVLLAGHGIIAAQTNLTSQNIHTHISYCQEQDAQFTLDQARACTYLSKNELPRKKFADTPTWTRIQISTTNNHPTPIAIRIAPHFLNQIDLYENIDGAWKKQSAGSDLPFNDSHATLGGYTFKVTAQAQGTQTFFLRVQTAGLNIALIEVSQWDLNSLELLNQQLGMGVQIGALSLILAFSLVSYLANPNTLMFRFFWLMLNLLLCTLAGSGMLAKYVFFQWPWMDNVFFNWMLCMRMACWLWISQAFFITYRTPRWYPLSCKMIYLLVGCCLVLIAFNEQRITPILMVSGILILPVIQVIAILQTPQIQRTFRTTLLTGFLVADALVLTTLLLAALPLGTEPLSIYFARAVDFINPAVLLSIFAIRNKMMRQEFDAVKTTNIQMSLRLEFERKLLSERRMLIDMLTHEMKNPLASISMAVGSLAQSLSNSQTFEARRLHNIEQSIRSMDMVIERCSLMNQVDLKELSANNTRIDVDAAIRSLVELLPNHARIRLNLQPAAVIETDAYFLRIILSNLIENALKYSPQDSCINIDLFQRMDNMRSSMCIRISNQAGEQGIPDLNAIFNRFYRNPLAMNTPGSGLGLYLIKEISTVLGGTVHYHHDALRVEFLVELPLSPP